MRALGPFAFQRNNTTRAFEYPWAFFAVGPEPGLRVLEIGGGLSGLQFVLSACGARVVNVDPGEVSTGKGWSLDPDQFDRLNRAFRSEVELRKCTLDAAHLPDAGFDRVVSISALEHVSERELPILMKEIGRVLRPGGLLVPYIVAASQLELAAGERSELNGFVEFEPRTILAKLPELLYGAGWPAVTQALVLRKAA
jgi:cyclopropane fatty-acyl-phospholipid synthase-like methyltransferase